jgi:alcohol dehydrogenase
MAWYDGIAGGDFPVEDMQVGPADAGSRIGHGTLDPHEGSAGRGDLHRDHVVHDARAAGRRAILKFMIALLKMRDRESSAGGEVMMLVNLRIGWLASQLDHPGDNPSRSVAMKALIYDGPGQKHLGEREKPKIKDLGDAIVRITHTTICGTDLHILKGDVPSCEPGRTLGHEGVGVVEAVGSAVSNFKSGDHVLISCITSCGRCDYCRRGIYSHCVNGGWLLGNAIDGTQAEYVRIPHADTSLYPVPAGTDEEALVMLSDILPTGFECGVLNGKVAPGSSVAIVGAGPIGLATLLTAQFYSPSQIIMIDIDANRLAVAERFGATRTIDSRSEGVVAVVKSLTEGRGVDTAIEAVGVPATFELCEDLVAPGGVIANIGVHGVKADLHLERLWSHNITITTRLVDTSTTSMLLKTVVSGKVDARQLVTHRFTLDGIMDAYDVFGRAAETQALKVLITP